ncbi:unnamed protein product [Acanthoscelides obtectus]|uniref:DUF4780 domain-containing protein n=1 Tax=Acanthoscelides obtectus TaxID=200917 RepID=A0A9P0KHF4_ACAOB|nr:unnamed protein product [Acanthoscelides obtectus]CAK1642560.1 hypothetical protein AOBTE_LOCUS13116 [Acanthoscelides obtectus]
MEVTPRECQADGVQTVSIEKPLGEMSGVNEKEHIVQKPAASVGHLGSVMNTIEEKSKASVLRPQGTIIDRTADYVGTCFSGFANEREIEEGEIVSDEESHVEENIASSEHTNTSVMKYCSQHDETANWKKAQGGLIDTSRIMKNVQTQGTVLDLTEKVSVFGDNDLEEGEIVSDEEHHIDQNSASSKYKSISEIKDSSQKGSPGIMKKYVAKETIDITDRIEAHVTSFAFKGKIHLGQGHEGKFSAASNHRKTAMKARSRSSSAGKIIDVADANLVDEVECSKSDLTSFRRDTSKATTDLIHNSKSVHVNGENKQDIDREGISKSNENFPIISDKPISGQPVGTHSDLFTDYLFNYVELLETTDSSDCECLPPQLDELKKLPLEVITKQLLKNFKKWTKKMERETKQRINTPANIGHTTRPISIEPTPIFVPSFILEKLAVLEKLPVDFITDDQKKAIIYWQKLVDRRNQIENSDNVEILEIHKTEKRGDEIAALAKSRVKTQRTEVGMQSTASTEDTTVDPISDLSDYLRKKLAKLKRRTDLTRKQRKRMKRWGRLLDDHQVSYVSEQIIESSRYLNMPETSVKKIEELLENCHVYQHTNSLLGPISKEASSCIENKLNTVETVSDSIAESAELVVKSADTHSQSNSAEAVELLQPSSNSTEKPLEAEATVESFTSAKDLTSRFSAFEAVATDGTKESSVLCQSLPAESAVDGYFLDIIYWQKPVDRRNQIENSDNVEILEIHKTEKRGDEIAALAKSRVKTQRTEVGMQSTASTEDTTVDPISDLSDYLRKKLAKLKRRTDLTRKQRKRMKRWGRLLDDHQVSYVSEQVIESSSYLNMPETSVKKTEELLENCQGYQHTNSLLGPISKEASSCIENKLNTVETVSDSIAESAESVVKSADTHSQSNSAEAVEWLQPSINSTEKPLEAEATLESFTSAKDLTSLFSAFEAVATDGTKESSVLCQSLPAESAVDGYFLDKSVISAPKQAETCSQFVFAEKDGLLEDESVHTQNILESEGVASNSGDKSSVSADTYSECGTADAARPRQELMTCIENMSRSAINSYFVDKSADAYSQFVCAKSDRPLEKMSGCIENITKTADANSSVDRSESFLVITKVTDSLIDPVQVDGPIQELSIVPESAENNSDSVEYIAVCVSAGSKDIDSQFGSPKSSCTEHIPNSGNGTPTDEVNSSMQNLLVADIYSHFGSTEATESPENVSCSVEMSQVCENLDSTDIASVQFDKMLGKSSNSTESISELIEHIPRQVSSDFSKFPSLLIFGQSILKEKIEKPHHHFGFVMADRQSGEVSGCAATSLHLINSKSIDAIESQEISTTSSIYVGQSSTFAQLSSVNAAKQVPEEVVGVTAKPMPRQDQASSVTEKLTATVSGNTSTIGIEQARRKRRHDDDGGAEDPGNTKRQRTREPLFPLRVAIVDQQYPDVVLTLDQSEAIEAELVDRVVKTPDYHGAVALQFNNCSYAGGVLWICCANNYTKIWLQMTISHLCRFWKDLWLKAVDEVDLPRRPKVMVFVPGKEPAVDEFRLGLCKDNPGLTVKYWLLIGRKTEEARGSVLAFSIDTRSYEMLENNAWTMSYKKSTLRCKVMKKINDLWEETFAQEHFASTCGTAKAKDSRKKKEKGYPSSSRD